ncbi:MULTISPECIES: hypothetical protein [Kitasatospora]|uniref:Uncharacterized protein n=1 Tax=Kitasatospora setae (strain ATCC 33774 / DSM 43861 / JCM 3304 / KCC A-0304 / NBRC 14216 / KM-6054) TaxID=452652 RepID=E4N6G4_KITSK|nr:MULTISPECIES: hypothetical protein [Kitasatospora]BAJ26795.1 hypothetical protein KSE_09590 [Kitasatospora setae KM-6054]
MSSGRREPHLVRAADLLRTSAVMMLLLSLPTLLPVFLWRHEPYGPGALAVVSGAMFGAAFAGTVWWWLRYFAKRLTRPLDGLPPGLELAPEQEEFRATVRRLALAMLPALVILTVADVVKQFPGGALPAGAAAGLLVVSRRVAAAERKRGGRLAYLLIPGPLHTGTRLWLARTPAP